MAFIKSCWCSMTSLSIVVASQLNKNYLQSLFASIAQQKFNESYEILICATKPRAILKKQLNLWAGDLPIRLLSTRQFNISAARNQGIKNALGSLVFFLDEDCILPHKNYLQKIYQFHLKNPKFAGGGYYLTPSSQKKSSDSIYNLLCNAWLESHTNSNGNSQVLLGGCSFYPREILLKNKILFDETSSRAGEEYLFNQKWQECGHPIYLSSDWSVYHNPQTSLIKILKKSWTQGSYIQNDKFLPTKLQIEKSALYFWKHSPSKTKHFPMLVLYGLIGRISALKILATSALKSRRQRLLSKKSVSPLIDKKLSKHTSSAKTLQPHPNKLKNKYRPATQSKLAPQSKGRLEVKN
ncbi:glycosyltransferase [bacterium]|nr:glycosyltransferase [bacterium]